MPPDDQSAAVSKTSIFKEMLRASSLYAVVPFGQRLASVLLLPLYTRYLTPADYGVVELLTQAFYLLSVLLGVSYTSALGYHYFLHDGPEWRKTVAGTCLLGTLLLGAPALVIGWLTASPLSDLLFRSAAYSAYFKICFVSMVVDFFLEGVLQWLRAENRPAIVVAASLFRLALTVVFTLLLLVGFHMGIMGLLASNLLAALLTALPLGVYSLRRLGICFDARLAVRMLRFSFPLSLTAVALLFIHFGDRFFLQRFRTLADVGLYGLAYKLGMMISLVYATFHTYWSVQVYPILKRGDGEDVLARTFTYLIVVLSVCALGLVFFADPVLRILTTPAFRGAARIVPMIVAAYYVRAIGDFFRCLFLVENQPGFDAACNWLGAAVCLAGYMFLIPRYGVWGAVAATLAAFVVIGVVAIAWIWRLRPFRVEGIRLVKAGLAAAVPLCLFLIVPQPASVAGEIAQSILLLALYPLLLALLRLPTAGEYSLARSALRSALDGARPGAGPGRGRSDPD